MGNGYGAIVGTAFLTLGCSDTPKFRPQSQLNQGMLHNAEEIRVQQNLMTDRISHRREVEQTVPREVDGNGCCNDISQWTDMDPGLFFSLGTPLHAGMPTLPKKFPAPFRGLVTLLSGYYFTLLSVALQSSREPGPPRGFVT